jgi:hypothetical protein
VKQFTTIVVSGFVLVATLCLVLLLMSLPIGR